MSISYRQAGTNDFDNLKEFHIPNFIKETVNCEGEKENQINDLENDFPHLFDINRYSKGWYFLALLNNKIVGSIGLEINQEDNSIIWLNTYSVAEEIRGKGIGQYLLDSAIAQAKNISGINVIKLVTLKDHSEGFPVMKAAVKKYESVGFEIYKEERVQFGTNTKVTVAYYQLIIKK